MRHYAEQYLHMMRGWAGSPAAPSNEVLHADTCPGWIHPEMFLRCNLVRTGVTFVQVPLGVYSVRVDGRKQVLGHFAEGGLHSCSCVSWLARRATPAPPERNYAERCGKYLNMSTLASDPDWQVSLFQGHVWKHLSEKPCRGARWWGSRYHYGISVGISEYP